MPPTPQKQKQKIQSYLKIRPFLPHEQKNNDHSETFIQKSATELQDPQKKNEKSEIKNEKISEKISEKSKKVFQFAQIFPENSCNQTLYENSVQLQIKKFLQGYNSTVFAYGQTASGKTHTIFGHKGKEPGIIYKGLQDIFFKQQKRKMLVLISYFEVYQEKVYDLLTNSNQELKVVEKFGSFYINGIKEKLVNSEQEAIQLLNEGNNRKQFGNSYLNEKSSRSHSIFKIIIGQQKKKSSEKQISEFNFVDLAGSETLTEQFGQGQQAETKAINLSLFNLKQVIDKLAQDSSFIPYRQSVLTKLLQNSLGGNSITSVICNIAPGQEHYQMSRKTLEFGQIIRKIENNLYKNILTFKGKDHTQIAFKNNPIKHEIKIQEQSLSKKNQKKKKTDQNQINFENDNKPPLLFQPQENFITEPNSLFLNQKIKTFTFGDPQNPIALFLHGIGGQTSNGQTCLPYLFESVVRKGFFVVAPDFPGYGESKGQKFSSRITENKEKLTQFIHEVITYYKNKQSQKNQKVLIIGHDYGGSAAFHYASNSISNNQIGQMFIFHPSWNISSPMEILQQINISTTLLWVQTDQFHDIKIGEKINKIIPKSKLFKFDCGKFTIEKAKMCYQLLSPQIIDTVIKNINEQTFNLNDYEQQQNLNQNNLQQFTQNATKNLQQQQQQNQNFDDDQFDYNSDDDTISDAVSLLEVLQNRTNPNSDNFMKFGGACVRKAQKDKQQEQIFNLKQKYNQIPQNPDPKYSQKQLTFWAVQKFKELMITGEIEEYYQAYLLSTPFKSQVVKLFGNLPVLKPNEYPDNFIDYGIYQNLDLQLLNQINQFSDFPENRQIFIESNVNPYMFEKNYLCYNESKNKSDSLITHKAFIKNYIKEEKQFTVKVIKQMENQSLNINNQNNDNYNNNIDNENSDEENYHIITVPQKQVFFLNAQTNFKNTREEKDPEIILEDNVKCKYSELITRAKMLEAALSISKIVQDIKKQDNETILLQKQQQAVHHILSTLDVIHLVKEGIHPERYCVSECGKLAYYGQGTCHIIASLSCAFLLPFTKLLGLEVRFRAGSLIKNSDINEHFQPINGWDGKPKKIEHHTWCETTFKPSFQTFIQDRSFNYINVNINTAYSGFSGYHISDRNQCNAENPKIPQKICQDKIQLQKIDQIYQQEIKQKKELLISNLINFDWENILKDQIYTNI
ncbi:P-loop containing nucleoside triphosphate hydrolase [Pseudocohnilembus persalinus]|uniref:p-loop containing nucleoside triphosphate hydrolase n=1 Tax=Pseudocohnilembus persalinus TaxID=266149 RepID=A0A0V0QDL1_PSEPJ|nr:P-loop containing nucleoside triphosphate hydrolase [Pseudocohnilembus persalinus]|eukprot:KRX00287.1 P-loop containing nucleoside triphosphate hydrolase [Pseudocohnilembus persalinus]